ADLTGATQVTPFVYDDARAAHTGAPGMMQYGSGGMHPAYLGAGGVPMSSHGGPRSATSDEYYPRSDGSHYPQSSQSPTSDYYGNLGRQDPTPGPSLPATASTTS